MKTKRIVGIFKENCIFKINVIDFRFYINISFAGTPTIINTILHYKDTCISVTYYYYILMVFLFFCHMVLI